MSTHPFSLAGKTALITGAGKGIGRAIALQFAQAGCQVACLARTETDIADTVQLAEKTGVKALAIVCNTKSESQMAQALVQCIEHFGQLDILVNNAGGAMPNNALDISLEQFNNDYHFNVASPMKLSQLCAPFLKKTGGNIINITSQAGKYAQSGFSSYGTAKAALNHLTRQLAQDFAPHIRVNAIAPGTIYTDSLSQFLDDDATKKMIALTPMKALGQPEDIANAALFLASDGARWMTGKILEVDGGAESSTWPF